MSEVLSHPKSKKLPIHGNSWKHDQITGWLKVANTPDDGSQVPETLSDGTPLLKNRGEITHEELKRVADIAEKSGVGTGGKGSLPD